MSGAIAQSSVDTEISELIRSEYVFYREEVKPFTDAVDLAFDRIPDGMLSEIRDFVGHLADAATDSDCPKEARMGNIRDAHTHLRRVLLDCYKLLCISLRDSIKDFDRQYRWSNLSDVQDGKFVPNYTKLKQAAKYAAKAAKKAERLGRNDKSESGLGEVYEKYLAAYNAYCDVTDYIEQNIEFVQRAAHKDVRRTIFSVLGWGISIAFAIWGIWLSNR